MVQVHCEIKTDMYNKFDKYLKPDALNEEKKEN